MSWPSNPNRPTREEAQGMLKEMLKPENAYYDIDNKATPEERQRAIRRVDRLQEIIAGQEVWLEDV